VLWGNKGVSKWLDRTIPRTPRLTPRRGPGQKIPPNDPKDPPPDSTTGTGPENTTPESTWLPADPTPEGWTGRPIPAPRGPEATIDPVTREPVGRFIVSPQKHDVGAQALVEPNGGATIASPTNSADTHTIRDNGSVYDRLNLGGHPEQPFESAQAPHGHIHASGDGPGEEGQGQPLAVNPQPRQGGPRLEHGSPPPARPVEAVGLPEDGSGGYPVGSNAGVAHIRLLRPPTGDETYREAHDNALDDRRYEQRLELDAKFPGGVVPSEEERAREQEQLAQQREQQRLNDWHADHSGPGQYQAGLDAQRLAQDLQGIQSYDDTPVADAPPLSEEQQARLEAAQQQVRDYVQQQYDQQADVDRQQAREDGYQQAIAEARQQAGIDQAQGQYAGVYVRGDQVYPAWQYPHPVKACIR